MKKNIFSSFILCFIISGLTAQNITPIKPKLSATTQQYLWKLDRQQTNNTSVFPDYVYKLDAQNKIYMSALIQVVPGFNEAVLHTMGVHVGTKAGNIWTTQIPIEKVKDFTQTSGIKYIELDRPAFPTLDSARVATHVDSVQQGYGLPQPYNGAKVVVGVIDGGFDYTHPTFYDTAYTKYRVKRVWEEKNTSGTAPANFAYGTEYSDSASIMLKTQDGGGIHGTHVCGIAAGSGYANGNNSRFRGMAYASDIVMVGINPSPNYWLSTGMVDMLDGMHYIYDYAASVNKPAVANLSWGCPLGPHDGTSLFSQACDNLTGPGKIFVISAGNNGNDNIHLKKTFSATDTTVTTCLFFSTALPDKKTWVDIWGDTAKSFCIKFSLYQGSTKIDSTITVCLDNTTQQFNLIGHNHDTCFVTLTTIASDFNNRPHMFLDIYNRAGDKLFLTVKGNSGSVNFWTSYVLNNGGYYGSFWTGGIAHTSTGDNQSTLSDMASTRSAITVGAYTSKSSFLNVAGQTYSYPGFAKGSFASFSSRGPTMDGRTKPNITAPGLGVSSAVNSADSSFFPTKSEYSIVESQFVSGLNGKTYSYANLVGTSMAAPVVTGIVALLLQADSSLTPDRIIDILHQTAITDNFTGTIPSAGNNNWGYGKVNAYAAIKKVLEGSGIFEQESTLNCLLYPNPSKGNYTLQYNSKSDESLTLTVIDAMGRQLINEQWQTKPGSNVHEIDLSKFPAGIYFTQINGKQNSRAVIKIVKQ